MKRYGFNHSTLPRRKSVSLKSQVATTDHRLQGIWDLSVYVRVIHGATQCTTGASLRLLIGHRSNAQGLYELHGTML